jgi:hypothetical protein
VKNDGVEAFLPELCSHPDEILHVGVLYNGAHFHLHGEHPLVASLDEQVKPIWVFAVVEPATGSSMAMPFRDVNTATMQAFLDAAASKLHRREHIVMIFDGAGWHRAHKRRWPRRITPEDEVGSVADDL